MKHPQLLVVVAFAALAAPVLANGEQAPATKAGCSTINLGGVRIFYKNNMRCEKAKHYARRLYKTNGNDEPRKFTCSSGSNFNQGAACNHDFKNKNFGWHPVDKPQATSKKKKVLCWNKNFPNQGPPRFARHHASAPCLLVAWTTTPARSTSASWTGNTGERARRAPRASTPSQ